MRCLESWFGPQVPTNGPERDANRRRLSQKPRNDSEADFIETPMEHFAEALSFSLLSEGDKRLSDEKLLTRRSRMVNCNLQRRKLSSDLFDCPKIGERSESENSRDFVYSYELLDLQLTFAHSLDAFRSRRSATRTSFRFRFLFEIDILNFITDSRRARADY